MNEETDNQCTHTPRKHSRTFRTILVTIVLTTGIGITMAWATAAQFGGGHWGDADKLEHRIDRMSDYLDLEDTQRDAIQAIMTASRKESDPYRAELATLRTDMRALIETEQFYEEQARIVLGSKGPAMLELSLIGARTLHAIRTELTPDQRVEADALLARFGERGGRRRSWHQRNKAEATEIQ
jgi:Spy/CpxP family protein refolding chaperone